MDKNFGKEERLKGTKAVSALFSGEKKSKTSFPFRAFYSIKKSKSPIVKFGVSVPKKKFKKAVDRNRLKRLMKEAIRINKTILHNPLYKHSVSVNVMFVCNTNAMPNFNLVEIKIKDLLTRLAQDVEDYGKK